MDGGGGAAAAIEVLVQNLINVSMEEISQIQGVEKDAEKLKKTLAMTQSFLDDAEKKFITDDSVKRWLKELEAVAFDADNVLDELNYHLLSKKMKKIVEAEKKKVPSCSFPSFNHCVRRRQIALAIKDINMTFESIDKRATKLGLERRLAAAPAAPDSGLETDSLTDDPIFIGRDDDVSEIVEMLTGGPTEQVFSVVPIVGMGGLGKTTLARKVFNHEEIKTHFGKHIWVHVSKNFDPVSLLKKILTNLTSENVDVGSREVLLQKLREALDAKTYLLVLDDVWNQDQQMWEGFINSLSGITSAKGNGIIVTTRNTEVASIVKTLDYIHHLNGLSEEDCWFIIKEKAFGERDIPPRFEAIGRNIAGRCQGLPLAANIVGGVLRCKSEPEWLSIKDNWFSDVEGHENNISKILKLSFDHLSSPSLKKCFAYCSIFPKGTKIDREKLIELWMAEGFLQIDQRNDMEIVGNKYFDLLVQSSLLQVMKSNEYDNKTHGSMHDLVHDLACSVLGSEYYGHESSPVPKEKAKCLRTLFFHGRISDIVFSDFKSLHSLTLMRHHQVGELPDSIRELIHLRYLNLVDSRIKYLPDSIGELYHLQTLVAVPWKLPSTLKYLINLRHLHVPFYTELPPQMGMLTSLQTLRYFKVGEEKGRQIEELGSLENLKGALEIDKLEKVDEEEAKKAYLFRKPNIVRLVLKWGNERRESGDTINAENVLKGLQPHPNLKNLEIYGFKRRRFPVWILNMAVKDELKDHWIPLDNLTEISLRDCFECEEIPIMGHLPHLKSLCLSKLRNVTTIGSSFYGIDKCSSSKNGVCEKTVMVFPSLRRLKLLEMPSLTEWVEVEIPVSAADETHEPPREVKVFPCLEYLRIRKCQQLRRAPSHFPCLKELDIDEMDSGLPLENICGGIKLTSLTKLTIERLDGLECLPHLLFRNNQNLSVLEIRKCPTLRELPDDLHTLNSLEELRIERCPNLKSIPYSSSSGGGGGQSQGLTSLRWLSIECCQGLMNLPCEMVDSCAPSLKRLWLEELSSLMNLPMIIECLHKMPRLEELVIVDVPKPMTTTCSSLEIGSLRSLHSLTIRPAASDSWDCVWFKKAVDGILQAASQSLRRLELSWTEDGDSLPDQLQHLTALSKLILHSFGIAELPEWFGNLSSLNTLSLNDCKS